VDFHDPCSMRVMRVKYSARNGVSRLLALSFFAHGGQDPRSGCGMRGMWLGGGRVLTRRGACEVRAGREQNRHRSDQGRELLQSGLSRSVFRTVRDDGQGTWKARPAQTTGNMATGVENKRRVPFPFP